MPSAHGSFSYTVVKLKKKSEVIILNFDEVDVTWSLLSYTFGKLY